MEMTQEQKDIVNTKFPEEIEKEAQAEVAEMKECYGAGVKLAQSFAEEFDTLVKQAEEEEKKEEGKEEEAPEKKLDEEQKKEAAAKGAFIARGYINELLKLGKDKHGDELYYVGSAVQEKLAAMGKEALAEKVMPWLRKAQATGAKGVGAAKDMAAKHPGKTLAAAGAAGAGAGYLAGRKS